MNERIYVQTNDADTNEVIAYDRSGDGRLDQLGRFETGGRGTGVPHLASQSSIVLSDDGAWLLVTNAGSDELTLFSVESDGLELAATIASGGSAPTSITVREELVYALNNGGTPNITGFTLASGGLAPIDGSTRPLSAGNADPAQISFSPDGKRIAFELEKAPQQGSQPSNRSQGGGPSPVVPPAERCFFMTRAWARA